MTAAYIILGCYLAAATASDVKNRSLSYGLLSAGLVPAIVGLVAAITGSEDGSGAVLVKSLCGMIPGILIALTSLITRGGIGLGDAAVVTVIGCVAGLRATVLVLGIAFILVCLFSGGMLAFGKLSRKSRLPFIPFLAAAYAAGVVISAV